MRTLVMGKDGSPVWSKESVFSELDKRKGKDLIVSCFEVREIFNLTEKEFYPYYMEWRNQ